MAEFVNSDEEQLEEPCLRTKTVHDTVTGKMTVYQYAEVLAAKKIKTESRTAPAHTIPAPAHTNPAPSSSPLSQAQRIASLEAENAELKRKLQHAQLVAFKAQEDHAVVLKRAQVAEAEVHRLNARSYADVLAEQAKAQAKT